MRTKILILASLIWSRPAFVCGQCIVFDKPEEGFARSEAVFLGKVIHRYPTGAEGDHQIVDVATFQVQRLWKGDIGREVHVGADLPFQTGSEYVVFASGEPLSTSILCHWTELPEHATSKLDWLSTQQEKEGRFTALQLSSRIGRPVPGKYPAVRHAGDWLNPYIVVCSDGVRVITNPVKGDSVVAIRELRETLVSLPVEAWPYGRIAALQPCSVRDPWDTIVVRVRLAHVTAVLESLGVMINRSPP